MPFGKMKEVVLGTKYDLSLAFVGSKKSKTLSKKFKGKNKPANVLSFPLSKNSGEIVVDLEEAKREAPLFGHTYKKHLGFLVIHGMLHLKGFDHGSRMDKKEKALCDKFGFK